MSDSNRALVLPNPLTPLAFIQPDVAYQSSVTQFASVGALAVLLWDILDNALGDYNLILNSGFNIPVVAYLSLRIGALAYLLGSNIYASAPTGNCAVFEKVVNAWCPFAIGGTAFLFFLRVRAVYLSNRFVVMFFFIACLGLVASTILSQIGTDGGALGPTKYCQDVFIARYTSFIQVAPIIYDTLVFATISWRLCRISMVGEEIGPKEGLQMITLGKYLPGFTRSLLREGQVYYLITLIVSIAVIILLFSPWVLALLNWLWSDPNLVVGNIMACRVYRRTWTGLTGGQQMPTNSTDQEKAIMPMIFLDITTTERGLDFTAPISTKTGDSRSCDEESQTGV